MLGNYTTEELQQFRKKAAVETKKKIAEFRARKDLKKMTKRMFEFCPDQHKSIWIDSYNGKLGITKAVKLNCLDCVGYSVTAVRNCEAEQCPLYHHRPYREEK